MRWRDPIEEMHERASACRTDQNLRLSLKPGMCQEIATDAMTNAQAQTRAIPERPQQQVP